MLVQKLKMSMLGIMKDLVKTNGHVIAIPTYVGVY